MADTDIRLNLQDAKIIDGIPHYEPGSTIIGDVMLTTNGALDCRGVFVRLQWRTEGRGDREMRQIHEVVLNNGALSSNATLRQNFRFDLPGEPWSFAGHYINIIWEIDVVIDMPMAADIHKTLPFVLAPHRQ
jgi:hypothetical protein